MKKRFCILVMLFCMICSFAYADDHFEINGFYQGSSSERVFDFDIYTQEKQIIAVSSLFSDIAIVLDLSGSNTFLRNSAYLLSTQADIFNSIDMITDKLIEDWLSTQNCTTASGIYSGNLFEYASSVTTCRFMLSDFISFLCDEIQKQNAASTESESMMIIHQILLSVTTNMQQISAELDPVIYAMEFDSGRFRTYQIIKDNDVLMTLSSVLYSEHEKELLISYKEAGKYHYAHYHFVKHKQSVSADSSFFITGLSTFPEDESPLYTEALTIMSENESESTFEYIFIPDGAEEEPLKISGSVFARGSGSAEATISAIIEGSDSVIHLSARSEKQLRPVSFSDKRIRHLNNMAEEEEIRLAVFSGTMMLASWVYPDLSPVYQTILRRLFFQ